MEFAIAIITSQGVYEDRVQANVDILKEEGFLILDQEKKELTLEQADIISNHDQHLIDELTSGPCVVLQLKRLNCYDHLQTIFNQFEYFYCSNNQYCYLRDNYYLFTLPQQRRMMTIDHHHPTTTSINQSTNHVDRFILIFYPDKKDDHLAKILELLEQYQFITISKTAKLLTDELVKKIIRHHQSSSSSSLLTSDVCITLLIEKVNGIEEMLLLKSKYSNNDDLLLNNNNDGDNIFQSVYVSESIEQARIDVSLLFPSSSLSSSSSTSVVNNEKAMLIIKPDVYDHHHRILDILQYQGFHLLHQQSLLLSYLQAQEYVNTMNDRRLLSSLSSSDRDEAAKYLSSGPIHLLLLSKASAIHHLQLLCGHVDSRVAKANKEQSLTIRAQLGTDLIHNAVDCTIDDDDLERQMKLFLSSFHNDKLLSSQEEIQQRMNQPLSSTSTSSSQSQSQQPSATLNTILTTALTKLCQLKPNKLDAIEWLGNYLLRENPNQPQVQQPDDDLSSSTPFVEISKKQIANNVSKNILSTSSPSVQKHIAFLVSDIDYCPSVQKQSSTNSSKQLRQHRQTVIESISTVFDYECLSLTDIIQQAIKNNNNYHQTVDVQSLQQFYQHQKLQFIPVQQVASIISSSIRSAAKPNIIFYDYPFNINLLLHLEQHHHVQTHALVHLQASSSDVSVADQIDLSRTNSKNDYELLDDVVSHYQSFRKLVALSSSQIESQASTVMHLKSKLILPETSSATIASLAATLHPNGSSSSASKMKLSSPKKKPTQSAKKAK